MKLKLPLYFVIGFGVLFINSCVDDKYDLDNLDSTLGVKLDELVVPINMSSVRLDQVLDIDNNDLIVKYPEDAAPENQFYAIKKEGGFEADSVFLNYFESKEIYVESKIFPVVNGSITDAFTNYSYAINDIDESLIYLSYIGMTNVPMQIGLALNDAQTGNNVEVKNLTIKIPENYYATYKGTKVENGIINIGDMPHGVMEEPIYVWNLDYTQNPLTPEGARLEISGDNLGIVSANIISNTVSNVQMNFSMSSFIADNVSGYIKYYIENPVLADVSLQYLPGFLKDGKSNLILGNPQLYLHLGNPVGSDFYTTLHIEPQGNDGNIFNENLQFHSNLILAGNTEELYFGNQYPNSVVKSSEQLKYILAGNGLPESISFSLIEPYLEGKIENLMLGTDLSVDGNYTFFCPFSFEGDSFLKYQKIETDFFSDDLTKVNVEKLKLEAYPVSDLPFDVTLTVYPLDREGNHIIDKNGEEVKAEGIVEANAKGENPLILELNQPFEGLNGVEFIALIDQLNGETLKPTQYITLNNIRATVSGQYIKIDDKYKENYE